MSGVPRPEPVRDAERAAALALLFQKLPADERRQRVANSLGLIRSGELDPAGIFVVPSKRGPAGVVVCLPIAGASSLVWPPQVVEGRHREAREDALVQHAVHWLRGRGIKLAQCLLTVEENGLAGPLERNGFAHITHLWYLYHPLGRDAAEQHHAERLDFLPYNAANADTFHRTLLRTYIDTLDCPEVSGLRTIEEVIAGHQAQGPVPAGGWVLAAVAGRPVGVSLLATLPESKAWELAYLGIVPEARGQGHGRELVQAALMAARAGGASALNLSVDARNTPARSLYKSCGFSTKDRREVYLASWR